MSREKLRIGFLAVSSPEWLATLPREFEIEFKSWSTEAELKQEYDKFRPDVLVTTAAHVSQAFAKAPKDARPTIFVVCPESMNEVPTVVGAGVADDILTLPLRRLDFLARLRWHGYLKSLRELEGIHAGVNRLVQKIEEDIVLAQKIQRRLIKDRFPPMQGLTVKSKYWCGLRSGGDYFDIFEFADKNHIGVLLSDASSYQLSTAFINSMINLPSRLDLKDIANPLQTVSKIAEGVRESMVDKDQLSIFYGVLDRKSFLMRYVNFGKIFAQAQSASGKVQWLASGSDPAITTRTFDLFTKDRVSEVVLEPEDRIVLLSDGVEETIAGPLGPFLEKIEDRDPQTILNEIGFAMRARQEADKDADADDLAMPPQDCSVLVLDVAKNVLRLAR